jgi:nucleoside-diphosphate kinase
MEKSLGILKPDCLQRKLEKDVLKIIHSSGLKVIKTKKVKLTFLQVLIIWKNCSKERFFPEMIKYLTSDNSVVFIVEGYKAIEKLNELVGHYDPVIAEKHTIRYLFGIDAMKNIIHSSLNHDEFLKESKLFF